MDEINKTESDKKSILFLDGLNFLDQDNTNFLNLHSLIYLMRQKTILSLIIYEPDAHGDNTIEYMVDMVIELRSVFTTEGVNYSLHDLRISKSRYQNVALGWQQYKIRSFGLSIFPSIHFIVHKQDALVNEYLNSKKPISQFDTAKLKEKTNHGSLIECALNGVKPGSTTALLGTRGTFKSRLTLDFLYAGSKHGEKGMLVSLIDDRDTSLSTFKCPKSSTTDKTIEDCPECRNLLYLFHQRPGCVTSAEFLNALKRRIDDDEEDNNKIKRIAFWDLTQIEYRFPFFSEDKMFLPALMDLCKENDTSLVIMGSENNKFSNAISAMAENLIFVWRDKYLKTDKHSQEKKEADILAMYVERCEGKIGSEGQELIGIDLKPDDKVGTILSVNDNIDQLCHDYNTYNISDINNLTDANMKIKHINRMQSLEWHMPDQIIAKK